MMTELNQLSEQLQSQLNVTGTPPPQYILPQLTSIRYQAVIKLTLNHLHTILLIQQSYKNQLINNNNSSNIFNSNSNTTTSAHTDSSVHPIIILLNNYTELQQQFISLIQSRHELLSVHHSSIQLNQPSHVAEFSILQKSIDNCIVELNSSINTIKQHFDINHNNNTVNENYIKLITDIHSCITLYNTLHNQLKYNNTFTILYDTIHDKQSEHDSLSHYKSLYETYKLQYNELTNEFNTIQSQYQINESNKRGEIEALRLQLQQLKSTQQYDIQHSNELTVSHIEIKHNQRIQSINELQNNIDRIKQKINTHHTLHQHTVNYISKQCGKLDQLHHQWNNQYSQDITDAQTKLNELTGLRNNTAIQLTQYQKRYDEHKLYKITHIHESNQRAVNEQNHTRTYRIYCIAANRIRFYWRIYWHKQSKVLAKQRRKRLQQIRARKLLMKKKPYLAKQLQQQELLKLQQNES